MSKLVKIFALLTLLAGAVVIVPTSADARYRHGGWRGGGYGWGPAIGFGFGLGLGYPYYARPYYGYGPYYGGGYYYGPPPRCGYVRVRVWRNGYWALRRAWRCW
jgi:hypothetical protein